LNIDAARDEVIGAMRRIRKTSFKADDDFEITSPDFLSNMWDQLTGALVILTGTISSIGLLVGGIGVMNIMLISVTERTQEIGIRKAIGARKSDIRVQFLLEAMLLTMVGGLLGIMAGAAISLAVRTLVPSIPATLSYLWVALGVAISVSVGLFFGYYPANRAANLDPIVCLRYE
jgi:putative ABC transport system permease protein